MSIAKYIFLGLVVLIVLAFALELGGLQWAKFFGPRRENVRRQVYEETKSYNEGKEQDLLRYHHEWMTADEEERKALEFTIRHQFADYDETKLSSELRDFLRDVKYN